MQYNRIKEVLDSKGVSQAWLAKKLSKSYVTVNSWCNNKSQPSIEMLFMISTLLSVDARELILDNDNVVNL